MGEVLCVVKGDEKKLLQWVSAKPDRYVVWIGGESIHARILATDGDELSLQQVVAQLLYLPFVYDDPSHPILQNLSRIQTEVHCRGSDFRDQGIKLLTNYKENLQHQFASGRDCYGRFKDVPAIVCGAGPSLKDVIPFLKENRDRFLILSCGAGMQALVAAGIEPHLAVHVDPDPYHKFSRTTVPLFFQLRTSPAVASQMRGPRFLMAGAGEFPLETWIEEQLGLEPPSDGGWTAATRGTCLANALGCPEIYFAGIDFLASGAAYAKGVELPEEGSLIKTTLSDGTIVKTRSDWLLAAEWLNTWVTTHPNHQWGLFSKPNPLMPAIPVAEPSRCLGSPGVSSLAREVFVSCKQKSGQAVWDEIADGFKKCRTLVDQFLSHFQTVFPKPPSADAACMKILEEIDQEQISQRIIDPIWNYWEVVLTREPENSPDALIIHRTLLLKSLADRFYA
jgi:hypothetical protein